MFWAKNESKEAEYGAMIKKKAKGKAKTTKLAKKAKRSSPRRKKERNPVSVHDDIAKIVESGAKRITKGGDGVGDGGAGGSGEVSAGDG